MAINIMNLTGLRTPKRTVTQSQRKLALSTKLPLEQPTANKRIPAKAHSAAIANSLKNHSAT